MVSAISSRRWRPAPRQLRSHSAIGGLLRRILARRRATVVNLDRNCDLDSLRSTRELVPLLMQDVSALCIQSCVHAARRFDGVMAEAGVLMGGSARLICEAKGEVPLHLFDVFDALQTGPQGEQSALEAEIRSHFRQVHGRIDEVRALLSPYPNLHFHPGIFPASAAGLEDLRFAFVHLDMDLVQSTRQALEYFRPRLVPGGLLVGDDFSDPWVRETFETFFAPLGDTLIGLPWGQVIVVKQGI